MSPAYAELSHAALAAHLRAVHAQTAFAPARVEGRAIVVRTTEAREVFRVTFQEGDADVKFLVPAADLVPPVVGSPT
jgi:hypothetical protein